MKANRDRLVAAMAGAGMITRELADASELTRQTINAVLRGCRVRRDTINRIARALGVDVTEIMEERT